ncbi:MAG: sulfate ABC transporter ATP-binding protein [Hyphomicrobiaceae bacterium]
MSIVVRGIEKSFGAFHALDHVSLELPGGELVALLGPSGCGKTTLLRIIAGLEIADRGEVHLDGEDASSQHARDRRVGFVFQHYALFRHMSVFENVAFGLRVKRKADRPSGADIKARVMQLLGLVQLAGLADRFPSQLSGGQRQRVALARALAVEPKVLLLDEPFGALDAKVRKELRRWLRRLHDELHITSLFVTHDQEEALEVADRIVLMNRGKIEQIGKPREVYHAPATAFAFGFMGNANELRGRIAADRLIIGDDHVPLPDPAPASTVEVIAYARPHDLTIAADTEGAPGLRATVSRILETSSMARIELIREDKATAALTTYEVEMTHDTLDTLDIAPGQPVRLLAKRLKLFNQNGAPVT